MLQIDAWTGYLPRHGELKVGLGIVLRRSERWRPTLQIGENVVGVGLGYKLLPVIDVTAGAGLLFNVRRDEWQPSVYVSIFRW